MPISTFRKLFFLSLASFSFFPAGAQDKKGLAEAAVGAENFRTFTTESRTPDITWLSFNGKYIGHPDAAVMPQVKDDAGMIEVFAERTRNTKFFINPQRPSEFVKEQSMGAIHYQENGQWVTIDTRLSPKGGGIYEASRQEEPVGFDVQRKAAFIKARNGTVYFNNWELYGEQNGTTSRLAGANWSNYTVGDDGVYITNIFPGIDASMYVRKGGIKTNFIISSNQFPGYSKLKFKDAFQGSGRGSFSFIAANGPGAYAGDMHFKVNGKKVLYIDKGIVFTKAANPSNLGLRDLTYDISGGQLTLNVDASYINTQLTYGKVVVDPMVQTISFINKTAITGSMNCGSATNSCNYTIPVVPPAGAVITQVAVKFQMFVNSPARLSDARFAIVAAGGCNSTRSAGTTNTVTGPGYVYTPDSVNTPNIAGFWNVFSDSLLPCMPAPACPAPTIPFTLRFWNTYCTANPNICSNLYVFADSNFSVRVRGNTLDAPAITRSSTAAICQGTSVTLGRTASFGVPPYRFTWLPGGQTTATITVTPSATTRYTSIVTDSCGNSITDTTTVVVVPQNIVPGVVSPQTICQFSVPTPLTAVGTNLLWYSTPTGGVGSTIAPVPPTNVAGTFNYYVSTTTICGESQRVKITVIVNTKPAPPSVITPLGLCQYDTVSLTANGAPNATFTWYYTPTGGVGVPNIIPATAYEDSAYYYVTQTVNGCESDRARLQVFVSYKPNGIVLPKRIWVCEGELDSFSYFGNATPPQAVFNWTTSRPNNQIVSGQGTTGPLVVRFDSAGLHYVRVQVNNRGCLSEIASQLVSVRPNPRLTFQVKDEACQDEVINVALSAVSPLIDSFKYAFPGARIVYGTNSGGPYGISYSTPGIKVISTMATTRECPSRIYYDTITVHPLPDARFVVGSRTGNCAGDSALLRIVNGDSATRYVWTPDHFFSTGNIFEAWGVVKSSGYVKVSAQTQYGCKAADSMLINAGSCCELYFPNAFSPNNDTKNDVFRPVTYGHHEIKTFRIINRWGQVVYESKDDRGYWDGTFNGKEQEVGTYYYYIRFNCLEGGAQDVEQKGELLLIR